MNRNRLIIGLFVAILLAALLSTFVYKKFQQATSQSVSVSTKSVVVAAQALPLGTRLDAGMLRTISWPSDQPMAGMFAKPEDTIGRALITPVAENEPILEGKLAPRDAGGGLPAVIPEGMRGLSVAVNDVVGVAGFVGPGTMVDVLVTGSASGNSQMSETKTLLENIRVLAAGQKTEQDRDGKPQNVPVITLLVTPEDAAKLALASTDGKIQLALRNTVDTHAANPPVIYASTIFGGAPPPVNVASAAGKGKKAAPKPAAPPPPPAPYTVEVITGSKRETKSFPNQQQQ